MGALREPEMGEIFVNSLLHNYTLVCIIIKTQLSRVILNED
jgi:hypothetical protein